MPDRRWWNKTLVGATGIAATTTLAVGVAMGAGSSSAQDLTPTSEEASAASAVLGAEDDAPAKNPELKAAREEARGLEGKEKREALKQVRDDVAAGKYGEQAQQRLEKQVERADRLRGQLPSELREDLAELRKKPEGERAAAREAIRDEAREGGYGKGVKRIVTALG